MPLYGQKNSLRKDKLMTNKNIWWTYDLPVEYVKILFPELSRYDLMKYEMITYVRQTDNKWYFRGNDGESEINEREVYLSWIDNDNYIEQNMEGVVGVI